MTFQLASPVCHFSATIDTHHNRRCPLIYSALCNLLIAFDTIGGRQRVNTLITLLLYMLFYLLSFQFMLVFLRELAVKTELSCNGNFGPFVESGHYDPAEPREGSLLSPRCSGSLCLFLQNHNVTMLDANLRMFLLIHSNWCNTHICFPPFP